MTYSETVDYLQGSTEKGAELLIEIAKKQKQALLEISEAEEKVQKANNKYSATMKEIAHVCKHLEKKPHFHITKDKKYYHFTPEFQVHISEIDWEL